MYEHQTSNKKKHEKDTPHAQHINNNNKWNSNNNKYKTKIQKRSKGKRTNKNKANIISTKIKK